jgi:putative transposase
METMARRIRFCLPEVPLHVVQRGNNRQVCFFRYEDRQVYLNCLSEYARETGCALHAYVLMSNHVHLLLTPRDADSVSRFMKRVGQRYVQYVNRTQGRSGGLWEGRFRSCLVEEERYLLNCYRYIELNPVRAGMVSRPEDYPWSSHVANIGKHPDPMLDPHPLYLELGREVSARQEAYRALFQQETECGIARGDSGSDAWEPGVGNGSVSGSGGRPHDEARGSNPPAPRRPPQNRGLTPGKIGV